MTIEILLIGAYRVAGSLPVLRWPLAGGILAILVDLGDLVLRDWMDAAGLGGLGDYQLFDKVADQVYLALFLVVALRWTGVERRVAVGLYLFRLAGFVLFTLTDERALLLVFPNVFEPWFLLVAALHHRPGFHWTATRLAVALAGLTLLKEIQEWILHGARLLDPFTIPSFVDAVRRWLIGEP